MGKGNWRPMTPASGYNPDTFRDQLYVNLGLDDEPDDDLNQMRFDDFVIDALRAFLPESFEYVPRNSKDRYPGIAYSDRDSILVYRNSQVLIMVDGDGDLMHLGVGVVVNPKAYEYGYGGLAERAAARTYEYLKKSLVTEFDVSIRTSPWTSAALPRPEQQPVMG
jgi:hypothetical protein